MAELQSAIMRVPRMPVNRTDTETHPAAGIPLFLHDREHAYLCLASKYTVLVRIWRWRCILIWSSRLSMMYLGLDHY
uniref:Uncharacterized protein n=1 Tax=Oryza meridionalis TaxID=40149 RepID=A0A0E0DYZ0_9ORYZ